MSDISKTVLGWFGVLAVVGSVLAFVGIDYKTTPKKLEEHIDQATLRDKLHDSVHTAQAVHIDHVEIAAEAMLIRICVRDSYQELLAQRMLPLCQELGVPRVPGDLGAREAIEVGEAPPTVLERPDSAR